LPREREARAPSFERQHSQAESSEAVAGSRRWNQSVRFDADAKTADGRRKPVRTPSNDEFAHRVKINERAETLYQHHRVSQPKDTKKKLRSGEWAFDKTKSTGRAVLASYEEMVKDKHRVLKVDVKERRARLRTLIPPEHPEEPSSDD
jgi:hypothetical protein